MMVFIVVALVSLLLAVVLPTCYARAKRSAEASLIGRNEPQQAVAVRPVLSALLLCGGVLPSWYMTANLPFTLFVLLLAMTAYVDWMTTWVPDLLIFAMPWVVLTGGLTMHSVPFLLVGGAAMLVPALILNGISVMRGQSPALASGDLYVLPAIGIWLTPESAVLCFFISLFLSIPIGRYRQGVPFITVIYPVFMVFSLCGVHFSWFLRLPAF